MVKKTMKPRTSAFFRSMPESANAEGPLEALGNSDEFLDFQQRLARVAKAPRPVLLIGERGTGKELAASRVHYLSPRWGGPFVKLNCAALASNVLESELFGHEAGAFTGAVKQRRGRFEVASGGTLFLDEIGQMPMEVQEKILRVVEYGVFERVGSSDSVGVDVRLVAATNVDLPALAATGRFKRDLLDRLSFEVLFLPSLRNRPGDIEMLSRHFASRMSVEMEFPQSPEFSAAAMKVLLAHDWPGNVRELKNVVERAVCRAAESRGMIREIALDPFAMPFPLRLEQPNGRSETGSAAAVAPPASWPIDFSSEINGLEERLLREALKRARFHQRKAAELLGLSYDQFRGMYRKHQAALAADGAVED